MKNFATILNAVITACNQNPDGFTLNIDTFKFESHGYAVAIADTQNSFDAAGLSRVIDFCIENNISCIGGWYNSENGKFYYDATVVVNDRAAAIEIGRINSQIAIFDLDNCEEIKL